MKSDFLVALTQLAAERNLPREVVLSAIEAALMSAYRKDNIMVGQNISVKLDPGSGDVSVYVVKTVVEDVEDELLEISIPDARKLKADAELGESVATETVPHIAGRIAAQTAKQVVMQRLREAERELVFEEFADKQGEVFTVTVQRVEPKQIIVELGRAEAVIPYQEQVPSERYRVGQKMRALLLVVERSSKGPELIASRADKLLLRRLFEMEVPEIFNGAVEIMAIAREPGSRSKVAVRATQEGVDPVGSCVGLRGVRIQNIVNELQGEKIDVVEWNADPARFIANALNPSQVLRVELDSTVEAAVAVVPDRQLSLAIGKEGQNARLAARLTGWKVDIKSNVEADVILAERASKAAALAEQEPEAEEAVPEPVKEAVAVVEPVAEPVVEEEQETPEPVIAEAEEAVAEEEVVEEVAVAEADVTEIEAPIKEEDIADVEPVVADEDVEEKAIAEPASEIEEIQPEPDAEQIPEPTEKPEREPVGAAAQRTASIQDVSEDVWSVRRRRAPAASVEPGQIRFAEDIAGLRGGVTASRRGRQQRTDNANNNRRRKSGGGRRRRR